MQVATSVVSVISALVAIGWRPGRFRRSPRLLSFIRFGGAVTIQNILGFIVSGLDSVLLGYFFGGQISGSTIEGAAYSSVRWSSSCPRRPAWRTAPSRVLAPDATRFERSALRLLAIVTCAAGWVVALVVGTAPWIVALLLGAQWTAVVPIVSILSLLMFAGPSASILGTLVVAHGKPGRMVRWRVLSMPITIISLVAGLPLGPLGVSTTVALGGVLRTPLFFWYAARTLGISPRRLFSSTLHYVFSGLLVALVLILMREVWFPQNLFVGLAAYATLGSLLYAALVLCRRQGRDLVRDVGTLAASMRAQ